MSLHVNQKVVCVRYPGPVNQRKWERLGVTFPTVGETYTVRAHCPTGRRIPSILLAEITNPQVRFSPRAGWGEASFEASCFRPLVDTKDIAFWTTGAPPDSVKWDGRLPCKVVAGSIRRRWRNDNPEVVDFWKDMEARIARNNAARK